jgi:hypothetical protein
MTVSGASSGDDEMHTRVQQSPLASQRAKHDSDTAGNSRAAKAVGYFTLGYKEGFNQWVGHYEAEG